MENINFENIKYDYAGTSSYVKVILDNLPENLASLQQKAFMMELYNYYYAHFNDTKKSEMQAISQLFSEKIANSDNIESLTEFLYLNYIRTIIFDLDNREKALNELHKSIIKYVGYQSEFQINNQFSLRRNSRAI